MAIGTTAAILGAAAIGAGASVVASKSASEAAKEAAEQQSQAQLQAAKEAQAAAAMTPEEKAYQSMMMKRATEQLAAPPTEFGYTETYLPEALESLQKYYMSRGWQPSPRETGLLIEPSQAEARKSALESALLRQAEQQQREQFASQFYPSSQRAIEQGAGLQTLPYTSQAAGTTSALEQYLALQKAEQATAAQTALGNLFSAYASPLFQQRIAGTTGSEIAGGVGGSRRYVPGVGEVWSPYNQ